MKTLTYDDIANDSYIMADSSGQPACSQDVFIVIDTGQVTDDTGYITETWTLSSDIFPKIFQIDPSFYYVGIYYKGPLTDEYGNTSNSELISYHMQRYLSSGIQFG